ncbi:MAG: FAD-dependent oxidoreductase [Prochloraceae cyanobacterium]|nr:FAD-dependent oxidoreductase [Prochloraceae cyanobacterium]
MAVDYDLVIIGASPEGIFAAATAASLNARVALVEQPFKGHLSRSDAIYSRTLTRAIGFSKQFKDVSECGWFSFSSNSEITPTPSIQLGEVQSWAKQVLCYQAEYNSLAILASLGVDVIMGSGSFCELPRQAFIVKERRLRSRAYLIATGSAPTILDLDTLEQIGYLTTADLWQENNLESIGDRLAILGETPIAVELAQNFARLGKDIYIISESQRILPAEDPEVSQLIQAVLEAEGVKILTASPVTQVKSIERKKWVQAGDRAVEVDEIILALGRSPNIQGLNLEKVDVKFGIRGIKLNKKLQTTNPRIYACGDVAGGYQFLHIAQYEASIAVKNALFAPYFHVDYRTIPWAIFTTPQLGRVGMTEAQARKRYGKDVFVVRQYFKSITFAQVLGENTGFCKLVVRSNGEILGAHLVGSEAAEYIGTIALALQQKIKLRAIANLFSPFPTLSDILNKSAREWQRANLNRNKTLHNFLKSLFICRRNWSS